MKTSDSVSCVLHGWLGLTFELGETDQSWREIRNIQFYLRRWNLESERRFCTFQVSFWSQNWTRNTVNIWKYSRDVCLFQIEPMLTQAISDCRWSWKEIWSEYLIHHCLYITLQYKVRYERSILNSTLRSHNHRWCPPTPPLENQSGISTSV